MQDKLLVGLITTLLGLAVVFVILLVLIGMVKIIAFVGKTVDKTIDKLHKKREVKSAEYVNIPEQANTVLTKENQDLELIAVIAAACAAMMDTTPDNISVKRVTKVRRTAWADAGRRSQMM